jgi:carboxypeptidase D
MAALACSLLYSVALIPGALAEKTAADYFVHELPGAPEPLLKMHAGCVESSQSILNIWLTAEQTHRSIA